MSIAPGPVEPGRSVPNASSTRDNDTHQSYAHNDEPPRYTRHSDNRDRTKAGLLSTSADVEKKDFTRPTRHVEFVQEPPESPEHMTPVSEVPIVVHVRQPVSLKRGLQIPSRMGIITSGFKLPHALEARGVSRDKWRLFTTELKSHAQMDREQWAMYLGISLAYNIGWHFICPPVGFIPATIMSYKLQRKTEQENIATAQATGVLMTFAQRWNESYFEPLGLHIVVAVPGHGDMGGMDIASTKLYKYQEKTGVTSRKPGVASRAGGHKAARYQMKEGHQRVKAGRKARIVVLPFMEQHDHDGGPQETGQMDIRDYFDGDRHDSP